MPTPRGKGVVPGCRFASACRTRRSKRTRLRARWGPSLGTAVGAGVGFVREWRGCGGGATECRCHGESIPSLPPGAVKWKGPGPSAGECARARMRRGAIWSDAAGYGPFDVINSPFAACKEARRKPVNVLPRAPAVYLPRDPAAAEAGVLRASA